VNFGRKNSEQTLTIFVQKLSNFFHQSDITVDVIQLLSGIEHNVEELRDYCTQDTLALVRIFQFLCDKLENNGFSIER